MSTKNYDGLRLTSPDLFATAEKIRGELEREFLTLFDVLVTKTAEAVNANPDATWDSVLTTGNESLIVGERSWLELDLHKEIERMHQEDTYSFSPASIGYTGVFLPNGAGGAPLFMLFGERAEKYRTILRSKALVENYGYWDNSDPDEDASESEWEEREKAWATVADESPADMGLSFTIPTFAKIYMARSKAKRTTE